VTTRKVVRAVVGLIVLLILFFVVNGWWSDYRKAATKRGSAEPTATVAAAQTAPPAATGPSVVILVEGLNFRVQPDATGASIRGLKKGEKFILVSKTGSWLQLEDQSGAVGWVNNNPQYVRIEKK
jgi:SH3-like domain-containing protein